MKLSWIPNAICVLRIVLIAPLVVALMDESYRLALLLIVVAGLSDGLDGFLARTFDWRSRLGSLLDPAADKLLIVTSFLGLTLLGLIPVGMAVIVILRDLVIVLGALVYQQIAGRLQGEPSLISKLNTVFQLLFVVLTMVDAEWQQPGRTWLDLLGAMVVFTSISSGLNYVLVWSRRARRSVAAG